MIRRKRILFFGICLIFLACKKDQNVDYPTVQITSPTGLVTYKVFDTVTVTGHVSDGSTLQSVSVYLSNSGSVQVLPSSPVTITSNNMNFAISFVINDIHLASDYYFITLRASNGSNASYAYEKIYVKAAPTKRLEVYAFIRGTGTTQVWKLDSVLHSSFGFSESGNFSSSDVSAYWQQLYIAALDTGNVSAINVPIGSGAWGVTGVSSLVPYFTNIYSYSDAAYVSMYDGTNGYLKYFDHTGALQLQIAITAGYYPIKTFVWGNYIFTEEKSTSSNLENLVLLYQSTGVGYEQTSLPGSVVAMYGQDNDDVFIFGNQTSGGPYMMQYKISGNIFYSPISLPASKLLSVTQIDVNTYLLGFANNTVYYYTYNPNSLVTYISGVTATQLRYDVANNVVLVADGKNVNQYNYTNAALMYTAPLAGNVLDIQILYNK
jgi:hypothetical protein